MFKMKDVTTIKRLLYIDQLKGVAIILVVIAHFIAVGSLYKTISKELFFDFANQYCMPIFFFLSGLVIKQEKKKRCEYLFKKVRIIIIPFLVWGTLITLYKQTTILDFFCDYRKMGYWYLWVLFFFYIFHIMFSGISTLVNKRDKWWLDLVILIVAFVALKVGYHFIPRSWNCFLGYILWLDYIIYFMAGMLIKKYNVANKVFATHIFYAVAFAVLLIVWIFKIQFSYIDVVMAFCVIFIFCVFFYYAQENCITNGLAYIGRYSLSIYVMHFFLLRYIHLGPIVEWLNFTNNYIVEGILLLTSAVLICVLCILGDHILQCSKYLRILFLGKI